MTQEEFVGRIAELLDKAGIPYMVCGSHASSFHGRPRATNDADFVIVPALDQLESFLASIPDKYYVSPDAAREALSSRSMFNVIDLAEGWKADLIVRKERPFSE